MFEPQPNTYRQMSKFNIDSAERIEECKSDLSETKSIVALEVSK